MHNWFGGNQVEKRFAVAKVVNGAGVGAGVTILNLGALMWSLTGSYMKRMVEFNRRLSGLGSLMSCSLSS